MSILILYLPNDLYIAHCKNNLSLPSFDTLNKAVAESYISLLLMFFGSFFTVHYDIREAAP